MNAEAGRKEVKRPKRNTRLESSQYYKSCLGLSQVLHTSSLDVDHRMSCKLNPSIRVVSPAGICQPCPLLFQNRAVSGELDLHLRLIPCSERRFLKAPQDLHSCIFGELDDRDSTKTSNTAIDIEEG